PPLPTLSPYTTLFRSRARSTATSRRVTPDPDSCSSRCPACPVRCSTRPRRATTPREAAHHGGQGTWWPPGPGDGYRRVLSTRSRSEEHTSELQSPDHL